MAITETMAPFIGRCAIILFYGAAASNIFQKWSPTVQAVTAKNVPLAPVILLVTFLLILISCLSLLIGFHARHGAMTLFAISMASTVAMHDFWHLPIGLERAAEMSIFLRDIAICGGLLLLVGLGPGPCALDNYRNREG